MRTCRPLLDIARGRVLRCALPAGHRSTCRPKAWQRISNAEYERLTQRLREAK